MNKKLIIRVLGTILLIEALAMLPALAVALYDNDQNDVLALLNTVGLLIALGLPARWFAKPAVKNLRVRDGFVTVALAWVLLSVFGALPFVFSGMIPNFVDALFESVSGFTTTGASVNTMFENYPRGVMFWRSFTHWIGGMGVLVLTLALIPSMTGRTSHLVRAESPGPSLSKFVPRMGDSAKILYVIYGVLTAAMFVVLLVCGMGPYDAAIHALGTAGTGGFSNYALSVAAFDSAAVDWVITFFMVLFGVNFALFYRALVRGWRDAVRSEELHWYLGFFAGFSLITAALILPEYGDYFTALRYGCFQVSSIMSTTGFATADFHLWPVATKMVLMAGMFIGGCAGSTAGGMKVVRAAMLVKMTGREVRRTFQPRKVKVVHFEGAGLDEDMLRQTAVYFTVLILVLLAGCFLISLEGKYDFETNFTAALTCLSNVGPGFGAVGPMGGFAGYGVFSKLVLCVLMLCGRLELFPILILFHPALYRKG